MSSQPTGRRPSVIDKMVGNVQISLGKVFKNDKMKESGRNKLGMSTSPPSQQANVSQTGQPTSSQTVTTNTKPQSLPQPMNQPTIAQPTPTHQEQPLLATDQGVRGFATGLIQALPAEVEVNKVPIPQTTASEMNFAPGFGGDVGVKASEIRQT